MGRPVSAPDLVDRVRGRLATSGTAITRAEVARAVREESGIAGHDDILVATDRMTQEFVGAGPLEPLLRAPGTTDVLVTAPDQVWCDGDDGLHRTDISFPDEDAVRRLAQRLALACGRRLDDAQPFVDAWLPGRVRLHAVLPPIAAGGTCISLRVLRPAGHDLDSLHALGTFDDTVHRTLKAIVEARLAFVITGGTGAGKTSLLNALLGRGVATRTHRDAWRTTAELAPSHPQFVRLIARPPNVEGAGEVTLADLVHKACACAPTG